MSDHEYHLLDPSEYQLQIDPGLAPAPNFNMGTGMVDDFYRSPLFPQFTPGGGSPGANFDLFQHYTETPAPASPFRMPTLPFGLEADKDGVGGTLGDWNMRFMPYIPGLNEPDPPDIEEIKRQHGPSE
jgi:hypothetical protein